VEPTGLQSWAACRPEPIQQLTTGEADDLSEEVAQEGRGLSDPVRCLWAQVTSSRSEGTLPAYLSRSCGCGEATGRHR
jgi:hypothetical protein